MREHSQEDHFETLKVEMARSNRLIHDEMFATMALLEAKAAMKEKQAQASENDRLEVRREFTKVLEERNFFEHEAKKANDRLSFVESELDRLHSEKVKESDAYGELLNIRSM